MRTGRTVAVAALAVLTTIGGVTSVAQAAGVGEAITGDVNADGIDDLIFLGMVSPDQCSVIVQYGQPDSSFRPPVAYTYLRPGGAEVVCPDVGVAVTLNGGRREDLVIGWSNGPPPSISYNLLVLDGDFRPSFGLTEAITRPKYMGTADFNGDGRMDVYSVTDEGQGYETYYSLGDGTLTVGPERFCSGPLEYTLRDFNRDGRMAALISYTEACDDDSNGVVKVSSNGELYHLQRDPTGTRTWESKVVYASDDNLIDVRTRARDTGEVEYFIQIPGGDVADFVRAPRANADKVTIHRNKVTTISVLANDYVTTGARIVIVEPPRYGTVALTGGNRMVVYRPSGSHVGKDRFVYRIVEEGQRTSTTSVSVFFAD